MFQNESEIQNSLQVLCADGGYTGDSFACAIKECTGADVQISKKSDLKKGEITPKRWIVERSFAWLEKCRRLWKNCEGLIENSIQIINIAFISLMLKRF